MVSGAGLFSISWWYELPVRKPAFSAIVDLLLLLPVPPPPLILFFQNCRQLASEAKVAKGSHREPCQQIAAVGNKVITPVVAVE